MANVILIEDNISFRNSLADCLTMFGHTVNEAGTAMELYQLLGSETYDVAVVDINLPHHSGFLITEYLSRNSLASVIITSVRDAVEDRVQGYRCGADIYMVKPVEPEELSAAITRLALKRLYGPPVSEQESSWCCDVDAQLLHAPDGTCIRLTPRETRLIDIFMAIGSNGGHRVTTRAMVLAQMQEPDNREARGKLDTLLSRLRTKVQAKANMPLPILTAYNAGFTVTAPIHRQSRDGGPNLSGGEA
ncbi:response regulator transcription factor [Niveispirillum fermenti]|uniref:response regulator transcription factor n=1 Tax=Niveispirillum fermenti TaxID=1233113 RepID=UPI003A8B1FC1